MVVRRAHDFAHPLIRADIARIDAQTGRAALRRLDGAFVVKVDVGNDRHVDRADDVLQRPGRRLIRAGNPDDVGAGLFQRQHLGHGGGHVRGIGVGHRLDGDRRIAADRHVADEDLTAFAPLDVAIGSNAHANCACAES